MSSVSSEDSDFDYDDIPLTLDAPTHYEDDAPSAFASLSANNNHRAAQDEWEPPPTNRGGRSVSAFASPNPPTSASASASASPFTSAAPFDLGSLRKQLPCTPEHDEEPMPSSRRAADDSPLPAAHAMPPMPMSKLTALPLKGMSLQQDEAASIPQEQVLQGNSSTTSHPAPQTEQAPSPLRGFSSEPTPPSPKPAVLSSGGGGSNSGGGAGGSSGGSGSGLQSVRSLRLPQLRLNLTDPAGASPMASSAGGGEGGPFSTSSLEGRPAGGPAASAAPFSGLVPPLGATRPSGETEACAWCSQFARRAFIPLPLLLPPPLCPPADR